MTPRYANANAKQITANSNPNNPVSGMVNNQNIAPNIYTVEPIAPISST